MPSRALMFSIIGVILQYGLVALLYYFLLRVVRMVYQDLKAPAAPQVYVRQFEGPPKTQPAKLIVKNSGHIKLTRSSFDLEETTSIGRSEHNDIVIQDAFLSHEHACITRYKQGYVLTDLNSTNGTFVNGQRVTEEVWLNSGDLIKIGAVTFTFER